MSAPSPTSSGGSLRRKAGNLCLALLAMPSLAAGAGAFRWAEATVEQMQAAMQRGELTSLALTQAYLDRIAALDRAGPSLRSVIETNPEATSIAQRLDEERRAGRVRGPLHGIPILLKDNLDTADRMLTTAGSLALVGAKPPLDSTVAARLREAGAVILGKTNLSEWANFRSDRSSSGWSGRGGQTRNPYVLDRSPSGSSSGSAVAVSANLCALAVGTETDGSIVSPSSACGIVGVKPTVGLVSRAGIVPISSSQDTAGPMARTVRDAAILLSALAGQDPRDPATLRDRPVDLPRDFALGLDRPALRGARLGVVRGPFGFHPRLDANLDRILETLRSAGAELVEIESPSAATLGKWEFEVLLYEFKAGLNAYFSSRGESAPVKSLAELIAFNESHRSAEMPHFGQELLLKAQAKGPLTDPAYLEALENCRRMSRDEGIDRTLQSRKLDALVALTRGPAWLIDPIYGDSHKGGSSQLAAVAGYPAVTVPADSLMGLPMGLTFFGGAWSEARLLALAADFERHAAARREPTFLPTLQVEPE